MVGFWLQLFNIMREQEKTRLAEAAVEKVQYEINQKLIDIVSYL